MPTIDARTFTEPELGEMLRTLANGSYSTEAAVELVISTGTWLRRGDFLRDCVTAISDGPHNRGHAPLATINWHAAAQYAEHAPASRGETAMLRLACSLAGVPTGSLRELTVALDPTNTGRLIDAIAHGAGWHQSGNSHTTSGYQTPSTAARQLPRAAQRGPSVSAQRPPSM